MVNSKLFAQKPVDDGGTPESVWQQWQRPFPELDLSSCTRLVIVAPHPDDEILGLGGTALMATRSGIDVQIVSVTDGGASHPGSPTLTRAELEQRRRVESVRAAEELGTPVPVRLMLPDGDIRTHSNELAERLHEILAEAPDGTWCASAWRGDGHPDHEATGTAAAQACADTGARLIEYPVWTWHWATPEHPSVPWDRLHTITLPADVRQAKTSAVQQFTTQILPLSDHPADQPILPPHALTRLLRTYETVFV